MHMWFIFDKAFLRDISFEGQLHKLRFDIYMDYLSSALIDSFAAYLMRWHNVFIHNCHSKDTPASFSFQNKHVLFQAGKLMKIRNKLVLASVLVYYFL